MELRRPRRGVFQYAARAPRPHLPLGSRHVHGGVKRKRPPCYLGGRLHWRAIWVSEMTPDRARSLQPAFAVGGRESSRPAIQRTHRLHADSRSSPSPVMPVLPSRGEITAIAPAIDAVVPPTPQYSWPL